ncbi:peptidase [Fodinicola feengrottensis]|uniref:Peptidase n=1 Tax=Fodinicola feengrottensis TaxID=435914 RepID=A0ABN2H4E2_9ACTN
MRTLSRSLLAVAAAGAVVAATVLLAGPAGAMGRPPLEAATQSGVPGTVELATLTADAGYWTADRMRHARPADQLATRAYRQDRKEGLLGGLGDITGVPLLRPSTKAAVAGLTPVAHIGKVFFTLSGVDYVCSGNVVTSHNRDVVATAGHCVNAGPGAYATNWTFVPAYDNGSAPYGKWTARKLVTTSQWAKNGDINYDTGFAVLTSRYGRHISDAVGASGVGFSQPKAQTYTLYGYPAGSPFDGETLQTCNGKASSDSYGSTSDQGVSCDMTGGSSGGPWLLGAGSGGAQQSINSFGYDSVADRMFGPYWGSAIQGAYTSAGTS